MVPAGDVTEDMIQRLIGLLEPGDIIVDSGNSNYKDTIKMPPPSSCRAGFRRRRHERRRLGLEGRLQHDDRRQTEVVERLHPIFETLAPAPDKGWGHVGPHGAGHFVKMVHNGIEYGVMQAYAEGFEILKLKEDMNLDVYQIGQIWQLGSVVRSWLLDLIVNALAEDADLSTIKPWVADSGEGRWTVKEAIDLDVPAPVISLALMMRFVSRQDDSYAAKLLSAMRNQFGGHEIKRE